MKYSSEIIINIPLKEFIDKFNNPDNLKHWQRGLVNYEHIHGITNEIGSKRKLFYKMGNRKMELLETITFNDLPHALHVTYDTKGMHNVQENFFERITDNQTRWTSKNEFLPTNFMSRMMTILMPGAFKKESKKYLEDFKNFAEKGTSIAK